MNHSRLRRALPVLLTVAIVTGCLIGLLLPTLSLPPDLSVPVTEDGRVAHPACYSIILPGNMKARIATQGVGHEIDSMSIGPDRGRSRYAAHVGILRLKSPPDTTGARDGRAMSEQTFQDQPAFIYAGPSGKYDTWTAAFTRRGQWFRLSLSLPTGDRGAEPMPPARWKPFLDSFRYDPPTGPATTQASQRQAFPGPFTAGRLEWGKGMRGEERVRERSGEKELGA